MGLPLFIIKKNSLLISLRKVSLNYQNNTTNAHRNAQPTHLINFYKVLKLKFDTCYISNKI